MRRFANGRDNYRYAYSMTRQRIVVLPLGLLLTAALWGAAAAEPPRNDGPLRLVQDGGAGGGIRETPLGDPGAEGAGTLEGRRGFGPRMWQGTSRRVIVNLLPHVPVAVHSPVRLELARRLLLSDAAMPGSSKTRQMNLNGLRVELLYAMGALEDVISLGTRTRPRDGLARRTLLSARMLIAKSRPTCDELAGMLKGGAGAFVERALIVCHALAGDHLRALRAIRLFEEQGKRLPARFRKLVAAQDDPSAAAGIRFRRLTALEAALLASGRIKLAKGVVKLRDPAILRALALSKATPVLRRMALAERAFRVGALSAKEMAEVYQTVEMAAEVRSAALRAGLKEYNTRVRAALYQAAAGARTPARRLVVLSTWWRLSLAAGDWQATAALTAPLVAELKAQRRHQPYAALVARVHLAVGDYNAAVPWFRVLRDAPFRDLRTYARLRVLMHLAAGADVRLSREDLAAWVRAQQRRRGGDTKKQVVRLHRLVLALGDSGKDQAVWQAVSGGNATPAPASDVWRGVRAIGRAGKVGETVMLTLVHLGERRLKNVPPAELHDAIRALQSVGLVREARRLAVEAALDSGM